MPFRYLRAVMWTGTRPAAALVSVVLTMFPACGQGARSPEVAFARFADAVRARDGIKLFEIVDGNTRSAWLTVQRSQRESYDILLSVFPEGGERDRQLRRFEAGARSESAASLFAGQLTPATWTRLSATLEDKPAIKVTANEAEVGSRGLRLHRDKSGRWGYAGLTDEAEQQRKRAWGDLEELRKSAADLERAAARAGK